MSGEPTPDGSPLAAVVSALRKSSGVHEWYPAAGEDDLLLAEAHLGGRLPPELRSLYSLSDGLALFKGNLNVYPLTARDGGLGLLSESKAPLAEELRGWNWRLPEELLVFGDNGGDEMFGLWLPAAEHGSSVPVIEIAEGGEPALGLEAGEGLAVAGTSLVRFLVSRVAYYLLLYDAAAESLDALGVPERFRGREPDDRLFVDLLAWADPALPDPNPHPYQRPIAADRLRELFGTGAA